MPNLIDARLRLARAEEHLAELRSIAIPFAEREMQLAAENIQLNPEPGIPFVFGRPESPIPPRISLLAGETIANLRSALDYLVYQLAWLDSTSEQDGTQFPIEDSPNGFQGRRKSYLRGVNDTHAAAIEGLQPYNGGDWLSRIRALSNRDKHRLLNISIHNTGIESETVVDPTEARQVFNPASGEFRFESIHDPVRPFSVNMKFTVTIYVAFDDGAAIVETLGSLCGQVARTLDAFQPEFEC